MPKKGNAEQASTSKFPNTTASSNSDDKGKSKEQNIESDKAKESISKDIVQEEVANKEI